MESNPDKGGKHILLTFDVEDWFQVENFKGYIPFSSWPHLESRVERNTQRILELLDTIKTGESSREPINATFFILGWLAGRMPHLVREIHSRGHEIASHGMNHDLCSHISLGELRADLTNSKHLLEDIAGEAVFGYRAPSFSINNDALVVIAECGYQYDSSFNSFAGNSRYGQIKLQGNENGIADRIRDGLFELPISNIKLANCILPVGGGGYFRSIPMPLFTMAVESILKQQGAYLFYLHPWEIDPDQPRMKEASTLFKFRHYCNLGNTHSKLTRFIEVFRGCNFMTCHRYLEANDIHLQQSGRSDRGAGL